MRVRVAVASAQSADEPVDDQQRDKQQERQDCFDHVLLLSDAVKRPVDAGTDGPAQSQRPEDPMTEAAYAMR